MKNNKVWHISYKAHTEHYGDDITWCVDLVGELAEVINNLYEMEDIIKIVDIYELKK